MPMVVERRSTSAPHPPHDDQTLWLIQKFHDNVSFALYHIYPSVYIRNYHYYTHYGRRSLTASVPYVER